MGGLEVESSIIHRLELIRSNIVSSVPVESINAANDKSIINTDTNEFIRKSTGPKLKPFPDSVSVIPTELTRVALFPLRCKKIDRPVHRWKILPSRGDVIVQYFGIELDQDDADVWLACIKLCGGHQLGERVSTSARKLLELTGRRGSGGDNIKLLLESLDRLSSADIKVTYTRNGKTRSDEHFFLLKSGVNHETKKIHFRLDPMACNFFDVVSYLSWGTRCKLKSRKARAIHSYISGHKIGQKHGVKIENLISWLGYKGRKRDFMRDIDAVMMEIEACGEIADYSINQDSETISWQRVGNDR